MYRISIVITILLVASSVMAELRVAATIPDYAAIAAELGGERVKAVSLIRATQDPHFADARPSMVLEVNRADLLVCNGLSLESGWLPVLLSQARNGKILPGAEGYLQASDYITPLDVPSVIDKVLGDVHPGGNPHFYTSPSMLFTIGKAIYERILRLDPAGRQYYEKRWNDFSLKYHEKTAQWQKMTGSLKGTAVVEYHKSWVYLIDWLGWKSVGSLEPKAGLPPTTSHIMNLLTATRDMHIRFVLQDVYNPQNLSKIFAQKSGARLLVLPSMTGGVPGTETIWGKFDYIFNTITNKGE